MDGPCGCGGDKKKLNRNEYKYWIVGCFFLFLFFAQKSKFEKKRVKTMQIVNVTNIQKWINDFHLDFCSDDDDDDRPVFFCWDEICFLLFNHVPCGSQKVCYKEFCYLFGNFLFLWFHLIPNHPSRSYMFWW